MPEHKEYQERYEKNINILITVCRFKVLRNEKYHQCSLSVKNCRFCSNYPPYKAKLTRHLKIFCHIDMK